MRIHIELTGKTPLMMHNERLSDPDDEYTKQIKELTAKKTNQTEKDKEHISKLEWRGGLYADDKGNIVVPTANTMRCFREAAAVTKSGRKIARGLSPFEMMAALIIDGPRHIDKLIVDPKYFDRRQVKVGAGRVKRTRPIFPKWSLGTDFELLDDVLNFDELANIIDLAGRAVGLCDCRILGYGRFDAKITKVK
jgi:hypothetical protein